jgi:hypothetical protein
MRALSVNAAYSNKVDGTSVILTCAPVILSDEIDSISWQIGGKDIE